MISIHSSGKRPQLCLSSAVLGSQTWCTASMAEHTPQIDSLREAAGWSTYWMTVNLHHHAELGAFR